MPKELMIVLVVNSITIQSTEEGHMSRVRHSMSTYDVVEPIFEVMLPAQVDDIAVPTLSWMGDDYPMYMIGRIENTRSGVDRRAAGRIRDRRSSTCDKGKVHFTTVKAIVDGVDMGYVNVRI